jgi:hypothetical protein
VSKNYGNQKIKNIFQGHNIILEKHGKVGKEDPFYGSWHIKNMARYDNVSSKKGVKREQVEILRPHLMGIGD